MKNGIENLEAPANERAIAPLSFPSRLHAITVPGGCQAFHAAPAGGGPSIVQPALYPAGAAFFASERAYRAYEVTYV